MEEHRNKGAFRPSRLANLQRGHVTSLLPSVFEELAVFYAFWVQRVCCFF